MAVSLFQALHTHTHTHTHTYARTHMFIHACIHSFVHDLCSFTACALWNIFSLYAIPPPNSCTIFTFITQCSHVYLWHFRFFSACCVHTGTCLHCVVVLLSCVVVLLSCMFEMLFAALASLEVQGNLAFLLFFWESLCIVIPVERVHCSWTYCFKPKLASHLCMELKFEVHVFTSAALS